MTKRIKREHGFLATRRGTTPVFSRPEGRVFEVVGGKRKEIMSSQPDERNDERMEHRRLRELSRLERTEGESCKNIVKLRELQWKLLF